MYLSTVVIEGFRCFGEQEHRFELPLNRGLTALVGENDAGKSAVVDALRFALGTTDQEWIRIDSTDLNTVCKGSEISVKLKFEDLSAEDKRALVEHLTFEGIGRTPVFYLNWLAREPTATAAKGSPRRVECHSGERGDGPSIPSELRDLFRATYLRPLRDASHALQAGRGSRLSQVLYYADEVRTAGSDYDPASNADPKGLNVLGIGDLANHLLAQQSGIVTTRTRIDKHLKDLALGKEQISSSIRVSGATASPEGRLRALLEKLDLFVNGPEERTKLGLGSDNLLFIACELLLLSTRAEGGKLLLIEEPEAHLHPQRQLRVMSFLQKHAHEHNIQVVITTHSPNLASAIDLENLVIIRSAQAHSLKSTYTLLDKADYRFLQRFLDVTKANLFFARGVVIVEGDAEKLLLPTVALLLGRDFTEYGVSIVNVGGVGLSRYARIFQKKQEAKQSCIGIPVACLTDMDVMPNCAPQILGKVKDGELWPSMSSRRWRAKKDFGSDSALDEHRKKKIAKADGQSVRTFVADEWTFEYDLCLGPKGIDGGHPGGLALEVYIAACLAEEDEAISSGKVSRTEIITQASEEFKTLDAGASQAEGCSKQEVLATKIYSKFDKRSASKAVAAQYLAEILQERVASKMFDSQSLRERLPSYVTEAIDFVTVPSASSGDELAE